MKVLPYVRGLCLSNKFVKGGNEMNVISKSCHSWHGTISGLDQRCILCFECLCKYIVDIPGNMMGISRLPEFQCDWAKISWIKNSLIIQLKVVY